MSETKAAELRTYTYEELAGHDVYELAHSGWTGEVYWSEDSPIQPRSSSSAD